MKRILYLSSLLLVLSVSAFSQLSVRFDGIATTGAAGDSLYHVDGSANKLKFIRPTGSGTITTGNYIENSDTSFSVVSTGVLTSANRAADLWWDSVFVFRTYGFQISVTLSQAFIDDSTGVPGYFLLNNNKTNPNQTSMTSIGIYYATVNPSIADFFGLGLKVSNAFFGYTPVDGDIFALKGDTINQGKMNNFPRSVTGTITKKAGGSISLTYQSAYFDTAAVTQTRANVTATVDTIAGTVTSFNIIGTGATYRYAPIVSLTGHGSSTAATATASIDGSGHLSTVTLNTPGTGYTSTGWAINLIGGGGSSTPDSVYWGMRFNKPSAKGNSKTTKFRKLSFGTLYSTVAPRDTGKPVFGQMQSSTGFTFDSSAQNYFSMTVSNPNPIFFVTSAKIWYRKAGQPDSTQIGTITFPASTNSGTVTSNTAKRDLGKDTVWATAVLDSGQTGQSVRVVVNVTTVTDQASPVVSFFSFNPSPPNLDTSMVCAIVFTIQDDSSCQAESLWYHQANMGPGQYNYVYDVNKSSGGANPNLPQKTMSLQYNSKLYLGVDSFYVTGRDQAGHVIDTSSVGSKNHPVGVTVKSVQAQNQYWVCPFVQGGQSFATQPNNWPWAYITHMELFGITPVSGAPYYTANQAVFGAANLNTIITTAHSYNPPKKVIVCFDNSSNGGYSNISTVSDANLRGGLVHALAVWARSTGGGGKVGIDGFGFDFEGGEGGTQADWDRVYTALRDTLSGPDFVCTDGAHGLLTIYVALGPTFPYNSPITVAKVDKYLVQGYDMNTSSLGYSFVGQDPINSPYNCSGTTITGQNDSTVIYKYITGANAVPKSQLLLGMPFYGRSFYTTTPTVSPDFCTPWTGIRSNYVLAQTAINTEITTPGVVYKHNNITGVSIVVNGDTSGGKRTYITEYPDIFSINQRDAFAVRNGLGGVYCYDLTWGHLSTVPNGYTADQWEVWMYNFINGSAAPAPPVTKTVAVTTSLGAGTADTLKKSMAFTFTVSPYNHLDTGRVYLSINNGAYSLVQTNTLTNPVTYNYAPTTTGNFTVYISCRDSGQTFLSTPKTISVIDTTTGTVQPPQSNTPPTTFTQSAYVIFTRQTVGGQEQWVPGARSTVEGKNVDWALTTSDASLELDCKGGARKLFLPPVANAVGSRFWIIKNDSTTNSADIIPNGTDLMNSSTHYTLVNQWNAIEIQDDGYRWIIWNTR